MTDQNDKVIDEIMSKLDSVIDIETGMSLGQLNIVADVKLETRNSVKVVFRPTEPCSPTAFNLGFDIRNAAKSVEGVTNVIVVCQGHMFDEVVNRLVNRYQV